MLSSRDKDSLISGALRARMRVKETVSNLPLGRSQWESHPPNSAALACRVQKWKVVARASLAPGETLWRLVPGALLASAQMRCAESHHRETRPRAGLPRSPTSRPPREGVQAAESKGARPAHESQEK